MAVMDTAPNPKETQKNQWLHSFLNADYFQPCPHHPNEHKCEKNHFCLDCCGASLCAQCVSSSHSIHGHTVLQVRRSSYCEVIRVSDISRLLDISHIQIYVINGAGIVFLNGRPQSRITKGALHSCQTCQRTLLDNFRFCSIGCKLAATSDKSSMYVASKVDKNSTISSTSETNSHSQSHSHLPKNASKRKRTVDHSSSNESSPSKANKSENADSSPNIFGHAKKKRSSLISNESSKFKLASFGSLPPLPSTQGLPTRGNFQSPISRISICSSVCTTRLNKRKSTPHRSPIF